MNFETHMDPVSLSIAYNGGTPKVVIFESIEDAFATAENFFSMHALTPREDWRDLALTGVSFNVGAYSVGIFNAPIETDAVEMEVPTDPVYQYILMRRDVPDFREGKAMAQAAHAANSMIANALFDAATLVTEWENETHDGFGTCIVLEVTAQQMRQAVSLASLIGLHCGVINDPTYPVWDGERIQTISLDTCAYVFGRKSECAKVVKGFNLF